MQIRNVYGIDLGTSTVKIYDLKKDTITKEDFNKMGYQARNKLFNENPELYKELSSN